MADLAGDPIVGFGTPEWEWRADAHLHALPRTTLAALLGDASRLVVVAPHPDDEVLGCGGLIAATCPSGREVLLLALSDGEQAYPQEPAWQPSVLGPARRRELERAAERLGLPTDAVIHLGFGDGALAQAASAIDEVLDTHLRDGDLVLVTWRRDGHPDHEAAAKVAIEVTRRRGIRLVQYPVWAWHWARPQDALFTVLDAVRLELPAPAAQAKRQALECFSTQLGQCDPPVRAPILPSHVLERFQRSYEVFII